MAPAHLISFRHRRITAASPSCMRVVSILFSLAAFITLTLMSPRPCLAAVTPHAALPDDSTFPQPAIVKQQMRFWERVFYQYPSTTVIIHESTTTDRVIDVIDYEAAARRTNKDPYRRREREELSSKYLKRYNKALDRFAREGESAEKYGGIERRVLQVYKKDPAALARLLAGEVRIRTQAGLADDFLAAAAAASAYMPYLESVFRRYDLPAKLARLPFVESMFNLKARSKVGASGLWQFMPETARNYIYVNDLVDERNSPFKATRAAAQFLQENWRDLHHNWPLAITAYNHGKLGMSNAVRSVGTTDLGDIIARYESNSFGFASSNFYAEFLAAAAVYDRLTREGRIGGGAQLPATEAIIIEESLSMAQLMKHTPLTREVLEDLNPCLLETTFSKYLNKPLPPFYELRVPRALAHSVRVALATLTRKRYAANAAPASATTWEKR